MADIRSPTLLWVKFALFVLLGSLAFAAALLLFPDVRLALLMTLAIWAFCRAYYFLFYVIEHYIEPRFRFSGLLSVVAYLLRRPPSEP